MTKQDNGIFDATQSTELTPKAETTATPKTTRPTAKQRKLDFSDYKTEYLTQVKIADRHSVNISNSLWEQIELTVRRLGDRGANVSSFIERVLSRHMEDYRDDHEAWRKL